MSRFFLFGLMLMFTAPLFGQKIDTLLMQPKLTATDYLQKSKNQKTVAWILTIAGTTGLLITAASDGSRKLGGALVTVLTLGAEEIEQKSYTVPYILSGAAFATGIGFFIAAKQSKKRQPCSIQMFI